ncbi:hypothetical protein K1719_011967 [Acacia pycnantha]|nr:hypothetical protein K1719_011967 [Acacia pycnantha]
MKPFRRTLVVKLMGRQLSYGFMVKKIRQIWERKGSIDIFDLENDFYLVTFQHMDDYMEALTGGPWVITDAYLNVARWRPDFCPKKEKIESVFAWVRLPDLPAPLFDKKFLLNLGNAIGKAIRLDVHTAQRARGRFAQMCVELDLTKPLIPEFFVVGQVLSVVYESLGALCNKCGWFGHHRDACSEFHKKQSEMRNAVAPIRNQHNGSRFSVLEEETGQEGLGKETDPIQGRVVNREEIEKVHKAGFPRQQQNTTGRKSEFSKGVGKVKSSKSDMQSKEGRREKIEKRRVPLATINGSSSGGIQRVNQIGQDSVEFFPESNPKVHKWQELNMVEKENLHPGEFNEQKYGYDDLDSGGM